MTDLQALPEQRPPGLDTSSNDLSWEAQREMVLRFLSHDMCTPLTSIVALTRGSSELDGQIRRQIAQQAQRLLDMGQALTLLMTAAAPHYDMTDELLSDLHFSAIEEVSELARTCGVTLVEEGQAELVVVRVRTELMVRVLVELLTDAIQSSAGATVRLEVLAGKPSGQMVELRISSSQPASSSPTGASGLGREFLDAVVRRHQGELQTWATTSGGQTEKVWATLTLPCRRLEHVKP